MRALRIWTTTTTRTCCKQEDASANPPPACPLQKVGQFRLEPTGFLKKKLIDGFCKADRERQRFHARKAGTRWTRVSQGRRPNRNRTRSR